MMADQNRNQPGQDNQDLENESRQRSTQEPASTADDRGAGSERRNMSDSESESLESDGIESDLDSETEIESEEDVEGESNR
jgi:hypothetical protein